MLNIYSIGTSSPINSSGGSANPDGSLEFPYTAEGADYAAVIALLAGYATADGVYANALITGQQPVLLQYNDTDGEWYEPSGGHGTQLAPFWSVSTGDDGIDGLPSPTSGAYAVIGKGTGNPFPLRGLVLTTAEAGAVYNSGVATLITGLIRWVHPDIYALGTPTTVVGYIKSTNAGTASVGSGTGGAINYNSTVANRVAVRASVTNSSSLTSSVTRTTSTQLAVIASRVKATGTASAAGNVYFRAGTTSDTNQFLGVIAGGSASSNTWAVWTGTGPSTFSDSGVSATSESHIEATLNVSSNALNLYSNGQLVLSTTSTSSGALGGMQDIVASFTGGLNTTISFTECLALEW